MKGVEEAAFSACDVVFMSLSSSNSFSSQFHPPVMHVERISPFLDSHLNLGQTGQTCFQPCSNPAAIFISAVSIINHNPIALNFLVSDGQA
jgi:hypothetical protein